MLKAYLCETEYVCINNNNTKERFHALKQKRKKHNKHNVDEKKTEKNFALATTEVAYYSKRQQVSRVSYY